MIVEIQLPSEETLRADLDEQATARDLIQQLKHAGKLEIGQDYRLTLAIPPHTRLERIVALGENVFIIELESEPTS